MIGSRANSLGLWIYAVATIATGVINLVWGNFEPAHQPIQAFGDHIPGQIALAYVIAVCLIAAGTGILFSRTVRVAAATLVIIYIIFAAFSLPRLYTAPRVLGYHPAVYIGVLAGVCRQLILAAAAAMVFTTGSRLPSPRKSLILRAARLIFAVSSIVFGLSHLTSIDSNLAYVPQWMPLGAPWWVIVTGCCFLLAALSILTGIWDATAAWLLGLMLLLFSVLVLAPSPLASPHNQIAWGANAYNLSAVGAAWILARHLARHEAVHKTSG